MTTTLTPRKIKGYGWRKDMPDPRDRIFNLENTVEKVTGVPGEVDLTPQMPPVYDQGQLGSCTGNGWAGVMEAQAIKQNEVADTPSRLFIYYNERVIENTVSQDAGAEIRDGAKAVVEDGVPSETLWPYDISQFATQPPQQVYDQAKKHEALVYKRIVLGGPGAPVRSALAQGFPIVFGFPVPDYFEQGWNPATEPLPIPGPNAKFIGGHCMVLVGYDFTLQRFSVPVLKARNSWSPGWGENGYCYLDYRWFPADNSLGSDLWIVEQVS